MRNACGDWLLVESWWFVVVLWLGLCRNLVLFGGVCEGLYDLIGLIWGCGWDFG